MEIKIEEIQNRLTLLLINSESYSYLYDYLDLEDEELLQDIKTYVDFKEGETNKSDLEETIDSGLSSLMDFYESEWSVNVYDDEGNEEEVTLSEAMSRKKIARFRTDWKLADIRQEWDVDVLNLTEEEDDYSLGDYYSDYQ